MGEQLTMLNIGATQRAFRMSVRYPGSLAITLPYPPQLSVTYKLLFSIE